MLDIRLVATPGAATVLAVPVMSSVVHGLDGDLAGPAAEAEAYRADCDHTGKAGRVEALPRPLRTPGRLLLVGAGEGAEGDWRAAGAGAVRAASKDESVTFVLPPGACVGAVAEGALLASYRYRLGADDPGSAPRLRELVLAIAGHHAEAVRSARAVADVIVLARDLVNTPSVVKTPAWFAERIVSAAGDRPGLSVAVRDPDALSAEGFGGILAVGGGSARGPRLVEVSWHPPAGAGTHVVLVGKGITFDTGGIVIKTRDGMKLMRKDMAGAAAVTAAALGAAALDIPVRVTALAPLAENMVSGAAYRPGDVVRQYGGRTSEIMNTDAEGRVVLADAIAYAVERLAPDALVDLATLTGAASIALGKRTAALFTENEELATDLTDAGAAAGERVWRMPLVDDYAYALESDIADLNNAADIGAGSIMAALYLREFTGDARGRWAHLDMSAPAWSDKADGENAVGATGWGVRLLLTWLSRMPASTAG